MQHAVAYYRVSTARQGRSGLGIEAQKAAATASPGLKALSSSAHRLGGPFTFQGTLQRFSSRAATCQAASHSRWWLAVDRASLASDRLPIDAGGLCRTTPG